jgi:hypothetical protein
VDRFDSESYSDVSLGISGVLLPRSKIVLKENRL